MIRMMDELKYEYLQLSKAGVHVVVYQLIVYVIVCHPRPMYGIRVVSKVTCFPVNCGILFAALILVVSPNTP